MLKSCEWCGAEFKTDESRARFCGRSCFGKFNHHGKNPLPRKVAKALPTCAVCGGPVKRGASRYCSNRCQGALKFSETLASAVETGVAPSTPATAKKVVTHLYTWKCSICGITEWHGEPAPLELDHIDGNSANNALTNLRLVCGNCGMLLPTYKAKNRGNGRFLRRLRYAQGESY